ncbi:hypothetical protein J2Z19_002059 [Ensifer adhaerens]|uniref:Uncharacterized protein n=1 Tax=Ensifer adhaerens TaxID=106592 RepID=A0ACC5STY0_ENSAD|nr:hypothetical protein [Ensifer adhaerens]MBP1872347.1 hypothetical protein [Ensifer adhaerens]
MDLEKIGRSRLKMRLPTLRALIDAQQSPVFRALSEEYAVAWIARDQLSVAHRYDPGDLYDLEVICAEIERDVDRLLGTSNVRQRRN